MLQSFYNYIVNDLLIGYFKKYPLQKGSRYFMIVENEKHRNMLIQALTDACDKITISGIYQGNDSSVVEESYDTLVIKPSTDSSSIIIPIYKIQVNKVPIQKNHQSIHHHLK